VGNRHTAERNYGLRPDHFQRSFAVFALDRRVNSGRARSLSNKTDLSFRKKAFRSGKGYWPGQVASLKGQRIGHRHGARQTILATLTMSVTDRGLDAPAQAKHQNAIRRASTSPIRDGPGDPKQRQTPEGVRDE
jgi:hypothetical protein